MGLAVSRRVLRLAPRAGLVGSAAIAVCSVLAAIAYRGTDGELYSPFNHYVSELGQLGVSSLAVLFNSGLIVGGACFGAFMVGLGRRQGGLGGLVYGTLGAIAGLAGLFVGVFPMNVLGAHALAALTFFNITWIAIAVASVDLLVRPTPAMPPRLGLLGLAAVAAFIGFIWAYALLAPAGSGGVGPSGPRPTLDPITVFEWLSIVGVLVWTAAVSWAWERSASEVAS